MKRFSLVLGATVTVLFGLFVHRGLSPTLSEENSRPAFCPEEYEYRQAITRHFSEHLRPE